VALSWPAGADRSEDLEIVRRAIAESRSRVAAYEREQRGLLEALEALDRAAELLVREVERARGAAVQARSDLTAIESERAQIAGRLAGTREDLSSRAVALYRAGELGAVRLLFSAGGLRDFLSRVQVLRRLVARDAQLIVRYRSETQALAEAERAARDSAQRLEQVERELAARSQELEAESATKKRLVARLYADRARERAALVELEKAARALEETLGNLGAGVPSGDAPVGGPPFVALRGRLPAPVAGRIVQEFGRVVDRQFLTETFRAGVVFEARRGAPVRAVASARVRFAGWFRGYGRLVILDHGGRYFSVSGHLGDVAVSVGDAVAAGEPVGSVGETGSLSGPRLYFEIRHASEALDPRQWLSFAPGPRSG
jgi:septal ring factor EnvC (AmiA/AmiB activator)